MADRISFNELQTGQCYKITNPTGTDKTLRVFFLKTHGDRAISIAFRKGKFHHMDFQDILGEHSHWSYEAWHFYQSSKKVFEKKMNLAIKSLKEDFRLAK